jgi:glycosyltransferase involved in cell wall biosynthesis
LPEPEKTVARLRTAAKTLGFPDLYLIATNSFDFTEYDQLGFDALSEFPPFGYMQIPKTRKQSPIKYGAKSEVYSYANVVALAKEQLATGKKIHPGVMPSWDNSARRPYDGTIYHGATPDLFREWLEHCLDRSMKLPENERLVFINAWNEWAEGAYLEPDARFGYGYLSAVSAAIRLHWRKSQSFNVLREHDAVQPSVSVVVPNFNHSRFLVRRFQSILDQKVPVKEIIVLDDASTDDSRQIIDELAKSSPIPIKIVFNEINSGSIFGQWMKGIAAASEDVVWICESDDTCHDEFLEHLLPYFNDPSITLAFGKCEYIDEDDNIVAGLEGYLNSAAPSDFWVPRIGSAREWFTGPFGIRNVIPNVGGCLFRKPHFPNSVLEQLKEFRICGDWFFYMMIAGAGRVAFHPRSISYFRRHGRNSSVAAYETMPFYEEHARIAQALRRRFDANETTLKSLFGHTNNLLMANLGAVGLEAFQRKYPLEDVMRVPYEPKTILMAFYGFQTGGGEIFPIHLANGLAERGYNVACLIWEDEQPTGAVRKLLHSHIPIYTRRFVERYGVEAFFKDTGIDLFHSHNVGFDAWLQGVYPNFDVPYVVTQHGSYEASKLSDKFINWAVKTVDCWVMLTQKNLEFLNGRRVNKLALVHNAMPALEAEFSFSRASLGIEEDAFVFGMASRALRAKGWDIAIEAVKRLRNQQSRPVYVALCGDGEELAVLQRLHSDDPHVRFLGFSQHITAFYRMCDACILPTRYVGESFPLTLIEALQAEIPIVASDMGEIPKIVQNDDEPVGIVVAACDDDDTFLVDIIIAMSEMLRPEKYAEFKTNTCTAKERYSMPELISKYEAIYNSVVDDKPVSVGQMAAI